MVRRHVALGAVLAFAIACGAESPTAPGIGSLQFTPQSPPPGYSQSATAEAGQGQIDVRATLTGPDPCRTLQGELEQAGRQLTLRVSILPRNLNCVTELGQFAYAASIVGLAPGSYALQVVHTYPSTGWETRTVLNESLNVR